jgi:SAM-dependent methyltransferase
MSAPFADHFSQLVASYASFRPRYPDPLVALLAELAPAHDLAWDAGCGTGQLSTALAAHFARVVATEPAARQLADAEPHARVEYRAEPAEACSLPDACADLCVAAQAAHWFDWPRYVAQVARVARPGALVALVGYNDAVVEGAAGVALAPYAAAVEPFWPPGREILRREYADCPLPWPAVAAPPIAMTVAWTREQLFGYIATWSATARYRAAHGPDALAAFERDLAAAVPSASERIAVSWPLIVKLARR